MVKHAAFIITLMKLYDTKKITNGISINEFLVRFVRRAVQSMH